MATDLLTVNEIADRLKVKPSWVYGETRKTGPGHGWRFLAMRDTYRWISGK